MKKYLVLAVSGLALASCQSDDFVGNNPGNPGEAKTAAINFDGNTGKITRATSNTGSVAEMLDKQFKVYGVKSGTTEGKNLSDVFQDYSVWNEAKGSSTSKTNDWEYVATNGTEITDPGIEITKDQTIKYWDYSSADYRFVAGSPISAFTFNKDATGAINSATVKGLAGHLNANTTEAAITTDPVYVANPVIVDKDDYQKPVKFQFVRQQSQVRVGVYETIPGYSISEIHFYKQDATAAEDNQNIILTNGTADYFVGSNNATGTITYNWTAKTATLTYGDANLTKAQNWYGGALTGVKATTSNHNEVSELYGTDKDMSTHGYFTVMPTPEALAASPILIKCDYVLKSDDNSGETIKVTGATAAIPAVFSKWNVNTLYTYIFKISQKTNGTTGDTTDPKGLYPITFDAAVTEVNNATQGTVTTFTAPTITTIQEPGSITDDGIDYVTGKTIYATVANSETGEAFHVTLGTTTEGNVQVYKSTSEVTEAELQLPSVAASILTDANKFDTTPEGYNGNPGLNFTPNVDAYYIIQYIGKIGENIVKTYKVVKVGNPT